MPLADDSLGVGSVRGEGTNPLFYVPGNADIPAAAPDPELPIGFRETQATNLLDNVADNPTGAGSLRVLPPGVTGAAIIDTGSWYMDQWWVFPRPIDFSNIVTEKTLTVALLNTFRDTTRTLTDLDESDLAALGITVTAGAARPVDIRFLEQINFDFTAAADGVAEFNELIQWTFDGPQVIEVRFTGSRRLLFYFPPQRPVRETIAWLTDIQPASDDTEQRQSLRAAPRQTIRMTILQSDAAQGATLRNYIASQQSLLFGVPIWWDQRTVTAAASLGATTIAFSTAYADFSAGSSAMVMTPDGVAISVDVVTVNGSDIEIDQPLPQAIPVGSVVVPLRFGYMVQNPQFSDPPVNARETSVVFETTDSNDIAYDEDGLTASSFLRHPTDGLPVLVDNNIIDGNRLSGSSQYRRAVLDNDIGIRVQFPTGKAGFTTVPKVAVAESAAEIWAWRQLLGYLRGSWRSFYLPTFQPDLPVATTYDLSSTSIVVKFVGAARLVGVSTPRRDVLIRLADGRQYVRRVTSVVDNEDGTETVQLATSPEVGSEVVSGTDITVSYAVLSRIEGDAATFDHEYTGYAMLRLSTKGVKN